MTKKLAFVATNGFEDSELIYPFIRVQEAGHEAVLISLSIDIIKGKHGVPMKPDLTIEEANPNDYDGSILPGGSNNPDHLRRYEKVLDFVQKINQEKKLVAAICHAGWVLISAKILNGRNATSFFAIKDDMINAGVKYVDKSVVIDENLITSRSPKDLPDFMRKILEYLD